MSRHNNCIGTIRSSLSAWVVTMAVAVLSLIPTWASAHEPAKTESTAMPADYADHSKMDGMSMTGDTDYDFAANMRMHHKMALDMAQAEIKNGKNSQMIKRAKDIVATQTKEIAEFDRWMEIHKEPTTKLAPK